MTDEPRDEDGLTKQQRYEKGLEDKGLVNVRVVVPEKSVEDLRNWAEEERDLAKKAREERGE